MTEGSGDLTIANAVRRMAELIKRKIVEKPAKIDYTPYTANQKLHGHLPHKNGIIPDTKKK